MFPGYQRGTWSYDKVAKLWYHHRFYDFQPDLNWNNPDVREEIGRVVAFWLEVGVSGFRMDGAPFVIEEVHPDTSDRIMHYEWLNDLRDHIAWRRGDAVVLAEANVPRDQILEFFGPRGDRLPMMFNFAENQQTFLALARETAVPVETAIQASPEIPPACSWATFLRNHDEIDLSGLRDSERADVFAKFGPDKDMQLYDRGIRRRLATMLDGDQRRIRLAYVLQFSLPGTPVIRYGEEIGMGEDLSLPQRDAIRTPMQWADAPQAGFSTAEQTVRPVIAKGEHRLPGGQRARPGAGPGLAAALVPERAAGAAGVAGVRHRDLHGARHQERPGARAALRLPDRVGDRGAQPVDREGHGGPGPAEGRDRRVPGGRAVRPDLPGGR